MRIILLGPPGAGKGTQGKMLALAYGVPHVATGSMIRAEIEQGTEFGQAVSAAIAEGNFAPDKVVIQFVCARLAQPDAHRGYILDGFPRDVAQAEAFDALRPLGQALDAVVELYVDEAILIERLSGRLVCSRCGENYHLQHRPPLHKGLCDIDGAALVRRADDEPTAVHHRMEVYQTATRPLLTYYGGQGLLVQIQADGEPLLIQKTVIAVLEARKQGSSQV